MQKRIMFLVIISIIFMSLWGYDVPRIGKFVPVTTTDELTDGYYVIAAAVTASQARLMNRTTRNNYPGLLVDLVDGAVVNPLSQTVWYIETVDEHRVIKTSRTHPYHLQYMSNTSGRDQALLYGALAAGARFTFNPQAGATWEAVPSNQNFGRIVYHTANQNFVSTVPSAAHTHLSLFKLEDTAVPVIFDVTEILSAPSPTENLVIGANITHADGTFTPKLHYHINGMETVLEMDSMFGSRYVGIIPAAQLNDGDRVEFSVVVTFGEGRQISSAVQKIFVGITPINTLRITDTPAGATNYQLTRARFAEYIFKIQGIAFTDDRQMATNRTSFYIHDGDWGILVAHPLPNQLPTNQAVMGQKYELSGALDTTHVGQIQINVQHSSYAINNIGDGIMPTEFVENTYGYFFENVRNYEGRLIKVNNLSPAGNYAGWPANAGGRALLDDGTLPQWTSIGIRPPTYLLGPANEPDFPLSVIGLLGFTSDTNASPDIFIRDAADLMIPVNPFPAPINLTAVLEGTEVKLTWELPSPRVLTNFQVFRNGELIATDITQTFYTNSTVINNTPYTYHVVAVYENPEGTSDLSDNVQVHTTFPPSGLRYELDGIDVQLSWLAPTGGAGGYNVYRGEDLKTPAPITALTYTDDETVAGETYTYKVTAVYGELFSAPIDMTIEIPTAPDFPSPNLLSVTIQDGFVHLTWHLPDPDPSIPDLDLRHFKVYRGTDVIAPEVSRTEYEDATAANQTAYTYRVVAVYTYQGANADSAPSNEVTIVTRYPVRTLTATSIRYNVKLDWALPAGGGTNAFNVYRNNDLLTTAPVTLITYTDSNTNPTTPYSYEVTAVYDGEESPRVSVSIITPLLAPPASLDATIDDNDVKLVWTEPETILDFEDFLGYKAYRDEHPLNEELLNVLTLTDRGLLNGTYTYKVIAVYAQGESDPIEKEVSISVSEIVDDVVLPTRLVGNYPNPFNPETVIKFSLAKDSHVALEVFNIKGQKVKTLLNGTQAAGEREILWNGTDDSGRLVTSGMYFYRMMTDEYSEIKRMTLLK